MNKLFFKIYLVWFFRRILPIILIEIAIIVAALKVLAEFVFVGKVLENAAIAADANIWRFFGYIIDAFFQTSFVIQAAILVGLGIGALVIRDIARAAIAYIRTVKN